MPEPEEEIKFRFYACHRCGKGGHFWPEEVGEPAYLCPECTVENEKRMRKATEYLISKKYLRVQDALNRKLEQPAPDVNKMTDEQYRDHVMSLPATERMAWVCSHPNVPHITDLRKDAPAPPFKHRCAICGREIGHPDVDDNWTETTGFLTCRVCPEENCNDGPEE